MRTRWVLGLVGLLAATLATAAEPTLEDYQALPLDYVTPHTVWAPKDSLAAPLRVLFFSTYRNTQAREIVELMQRFPIRADAAYFLTIVDSTDTQWAGGAAGVDRIRRLLDQPYDVYLFNGVPVTNLPTELQYKLLKRVTEGAGLVLVGVDDPRVLKRKLPASADVAGDTFQIKDGLGVRLPAAPVPTYRFGWEVEYDYWQERLGRAVMWAAHKLPNHPASLELAAKTFVHGQLPASLGTILYPYPPRFRVRRDDGLVVREWAEPKAPAGPAKLDIKAPADLPAGNYHLDAWSGKSWATAPFAVTCPRLVEVTLERDWGEVGDRLSGAAALKGQSVPGERVAIELRDRRGRIVARTAPAAPQGERLPFSFAVAETFPMLLQVRAVVLDRGGEATDAWTWFHVTQRQRGKFNFLVWDVPGGPTGPYAEAMLARMGMTLQLSGFGEAGPSPMIGANDVSVVPYTTRIMDEKDAQGFTKPVPWNQEPEIQRYVDDLAAKYQKARQHGVFVYSLGDETVTRGSDVGPSDLAAYRKYLAEQYGGIAALNESWGTSFADFEAITLLDPKDPKESEAKRKGAYARWYDRQAWECRNFINLCRRFGDAYRKLDPQAKTGFEGAGTLGAGDDFDGIVRANGFWSPYPGPGDLIIRDIAPREFPRANWMGYEKDAPPLADRYWRMVMNGNDSVWYWRWDNIEQFIGVLTPVLTPYPQIAEVWRDTRVCREGLGDLLLHAAPQDDGIALLYSMPSAYATQVADGPSYGNYEQAQEHWVRALFNRGLNFRYVTDGMLKRGEFDPKRFKVLILPRAEALSDEEAKVIRGFAEQGGLVIADLRPGRYTAHVKPRVAGALDDLFGIDSSASEPAKSGPVELSLDSQVIGRPRVTWQQPGLLSDPSVKVRGSMALGGSGEAPAIVVRGAGQGQAVLLNLGVAGLDEPLREGEQHPDLLLGLLAGLGVTPYAKLTRQAPVGDVRVGRWAAGPGQLLMVQTQMNNKQPETVRLALPAAARVYDLKAGKDLGTCKEFAATLSPGSAGVYAVLPGAAPRVDARLSAGRAPAGTTPTLSLGVRGAVSDAVLLTATRPDGSEADWLRKVVVLPAGQTVTVPLPLADNDPAGAWKLQVKELFSQTVSTVTLTVEEAR